MESDPDSPIPTNEPFQGARVTQMLVQHLDEVAALHLMALPPSFFASLGPRFLRRYYESFLASPYGIALSVTQAQQVCGFVVGSSAAADHSAWVVRHRGLRLASAALLAMAIRPRVLVRFVSTRGTRYLHGLLRRLRHQSDVPPGGSPASGHPAVLAHVAVDSAWRGQGLGDVLVRAFEQEAHRAGADRVELVTLDGPDGAAGFYERLGYTATRARRDDEGRRWLYFRRQRQTPGRRT